VAGCPLSACAHTKERKQERKTERLKERKTKKKKRKKAKHDEGGVICLRCGGVRFMTASNQCSYVKKMTIDVSNKKA